MEGGGGQRVGAALTLSEAGRGFSSGDAELRIATTRSLCGTESQSWDGCRWDPGWDRAAEPGDVFISHFTAGFLKAFGAREVTGPCHCRI